MSKFDYRIQFQIDYRVLSILLLVALIPLGLGVSWLCKSYERSIIEMTGNQLGDVSDAASYSVNAYLQQQILRTASLAQVPELRNAVIRSNEELRGDFETMRRKMPEREKEWGSLDSRSSAVTSILDNPTARFLQRYSTVNHGIREILVTDLLGRTVAATAKTEKFYHANSDWWKECYGDGLLGASYVGDARPDWQRQFYAFDLAQPLVDEENGVFGTIRVTVDLQGIHALLVGIKVGPATKVALIRARGDVISAEGYRTSDEIVFPGTLDILTARERGRRYFISQELGPAVYGLSQTNLRSTYPNLNWILTARQEVKEALGPWPDFRFYFLALLAATPVPAILAVVMLGRMMTGPSLAEDPHLDRL